MKSPPPRLNLATYCLAPAAVRDSGKPALLVYGNLNAAPRAWTYEALYGQTRRIAAGFHAAGLKPGDRIMIRLGNSAEFALAYFGAIGAGLIAVPTSSALTKDEITFIHSDSGARAIVLAPDLTAPRHLQSTVTITQDALVAMTRSMDPAPFVDTAADDPAFLIYTSGTTARPKGVLHAHRSILGRRPMVDGWHGIGPGDVVLHAGAMNWTYTLGVGLSDPWAQGATAVVSTVQRQPEDWPHLIRSCRATVFAAVPTLFRQILKYSPPGPIDAGNLRNGLTAGEALSMAVAEEWQKRTGTSLLEAFGMSEVSTYLSRPASLRQKPGSPGRPQQGRQVEILPADSDSTTPVGIGEIGVIAVRRDDPGLMLGYWNRPEEEAAMTRGDWFITGDLAHRDADGDFFIDGRSNDLMNARGFRVSPVEVETCLRGCADVADVAVAECPVQADLSIIAAYVVWQDDARPEAMLAHAREHLAAYKVPDEVVSVASLPYNANGKLQRKALPRLRTAKNRY